MSTTTDNAPAEIDPPATNDSVNESASAVEQEPDAGDQHAIAEEPPPQPEPQIANDNSAPKATELPATGTE